MTEPPQPSRSPMLGVVPTWRLIVETWNERNRPPDVPLLTMAFDIAQCQWKLKYWMLTQLAAGRDDVLEMLAQPDNNYPVLAAVELAARQAEIDREFARMFPGSAEMPPVDTPPGELFAGMAMAWVEVTMTMQSARHRFENGELPAGAPVHVPAMAELEKRCDAYEELLNDLREGRRCLRLSGEPKPSPSQNETASPTEQSGSTNE